MSETFEIRRDDGRDIRFTGTCLATVANSADRARGRAWSGEVGRSQELSLYRTAKGTYICERISYTEWQGEHTSHEAEIYNDIFGVMDFFGQGRLAKQLYDEARLDTAEEVE